MARKNPRPDWLTIKIPLNNDQTKVRGCLGDKGLHTVCASARCPNQAECYGKGQATFLLMGPDCTRRCGFCAVSRDTPAPLDPQEPQRVAQAVKELKLKHAVITSVTRDDLPDGGAAHFAETVQAVRAANPGITVEILVPDFAGNRAAWEVSADSRPDVYNHNLETVRRLYPFVRPIADYERSLAQLLYVKERHPQMTTKSGLMVGLGESFEEVLAAGEDLARHRVGILTIGQYLAPVNGKNLPVQYYMPPEEFSRLETEMKKMGFALVAAGPFVRSSYNAAEAFARSRE